MKENFLISIIVPIYNVEKYLDRCIESICNQTVNNIEIILIDDGSKDNSLSICKKWEKRDNRIVLIHKQNEGLSSTRNMGINTAKGDFIMFVDSDDYIVDDACERFLNTVEDADIVVGEATIIYKDKIQHRVHTNLRENVIYTGKEYSIEAIKRGEWFAASCYNFYRREYLLKNNLFFKKGVYHEDIEYTPRLFLHASKVKYLKYEFYKYVIRDDSITGKKTDKHFNDLMTIYSEWKKLNETISDKELKKYYSAVLSKYVISTCKTYHMENNILPNGIDNLYLISNHINLVEYIKSLFFVFFRKIYVHL